MNQDLPLISKLRFRGGNLSAIKDKTHELILCSEADTGKTVALTFKHIIIANSIPNLHGALVRRTYNSLQDSAVKTWDRLIRGLGIRKLGGSRTDKYLFPNGSEIVLVGMDKPDKLLSSEWDTIQVCQAEELKEAEWEIAASRVTGRGAVFKHPQIFGDCNPGPSQHWIRKRKSLKLIVGTKKDNPELFDDEGNLTPEGKRRLDLAEKMYTGVRRQRLLYGIWATAEGAVYDMFSQENICERPLLDFKRFLLTLDEGYHNPAVMLLVGEDSDSRLHIIKEYYRREQRPEIVIEETKAWFNEFGCSQIYVDEAAAGLIADLRAKGLPVQGAKGRTPYSTGKHIILDGISAVQQRLSKYSDGRPRLTVDPSCVNTINEFESYRWKDGKDEPEKEYDHAMDAIRYLVAAIMNKTSFDSAQGFRVGGIPDESRIFVPDYLALDEL